jgi:hypothetical protein
MDRITREQLETRVDALNYRMLKRGSLYRYEIRQSNGMTGLYRLNRHNSRVDHITSGTKNEIGQFMYAMAVALDDAKVKV